MCEMKGYFKTINRNNIKEVKSNKYKTTSKGKSSNSYCLNDLDENN